MPRLARLVVSSSVVLAVAAHLASVRVESAGDFWIAAAAVLLAAAGARVASAWTGRALLVLAFVAPALLLTASEVSTQFHALWLAPMAAWLVAGGVSAPWSVPRPFRAVAVTAAVLVAGCWPIVFLRELDFRLSLLGSPMSNGITRDAIWLWTHGVTTEALSFLVAVLWFDRLFAASGKPESGGEIRRDVLMPMALGAGICSLVTVYQAWVDPAFLSYGVWLELKRATGTLLDANAVGIVAATWGVVLTGVIWSGNRARRRWLALVPLVLGCMAVLASGSRTGFAAFSVGVICLGIGAWQGRGNAASGKIPAVVVGVVVVLVVLLSLASLRTTNPLRRLAAGLPPPTAEGAARFARSLWVRDGWGVAANAAIEAHPWTGVGLGTFERQSVDYYYRMTGALLPPDNAQNWWREQVAESGVPGGVLAVAWTWLLGGLLLGRKAAPGQETAAGGVRGALLGVGVASLFGVPTVVPVMAVSVATFVYLALRFRSDVRVSDERVSGYFCAQRPFDLQFCDRDSSVISEGAAHKSTPRPSGPSRRGVVFAAAVVAILGGQLYAATHSLRPPMRAMQVGAQYGYGFWRGGVTAAGEPFWWTGAHAVFVFPVSAGVLEFVATPMHPDIARSPVRVEIWLDGHVLVDRAARDQSPIVMRLPARPGQRGVFLETRVSRTFTDRPGGEERGLRIERR